MKIRVINLSLLVLLLAISAYSQNETAKPSPTPVPVSLKTLPAAQRYTDAEKHFSIWMPATPKAATVTPPADPVKGSTKYQYKWDVDEGFFALTRSVFEHRTFNTEAEINEFLALMRDNIQKVPETKIVSEKPLANGKWRGADMVFTSGEWIKTLARVMVSGNEVYVLTATVDHNVPDAEKLLLKAMDSLEIKASAAKPGSAGLLARLNINFYQKGASL